MGSGIWSLVYSCKLNLGFIDFFDIWLFFTNPKYQGSENGDFTKSTLI